MLPWRPLGMLAFGLIVIYLFIRIHGDGYDYPAQVAELGAELGFLKLPDITYLEISGNIHHNYFRELWRDHIRSSIHHDMDGKGASEDPHSQIREEGAHHGGDVVIEEDPSWIWMTNIWHESSECGPGHLRQYRRRLDHALLNDDSTSWELMYTHKFPGQITHTSLSRRKNEDEDQGAEKESIRLAIVYKVVRDEHVAYHSRVYHFGIYETRTELEECNVGFLETCHVHAPFVSFDYILPGSTPFKDVSLEHDMILYSRLIDTAAFRSLKLPVLQPGATSPEHPYVLDSGVPGPSLSMKSASCFLPPCRFFIKCLTNVELHL
ncbi:MAG: hypothetical protein J3Q66DRAFT_151039 [Benniella sp.]|nr:MAG: hypothetical protein J3Q66DRAFT_151039 [Benniella sp.]